MKHFKKVYFVIELKAKIVEILGKKDMSLKEKTSNKLSQNKFFCIVISMVSHFGRHQKKSPQFLLLVNYGYIHEFNTRAIRTY